jgi:hypothetical protein
MVTVKKIDEGKSLNEHKLTLGVIPHFHSLMKLHSHELNQIPNLNLVTHSEHQAVIHSTVHYGNDPSQI